MNEFNLAMQVANHALQTGILATKCCDKEAVELFWRAYDVLMNKPVYKIPEIRK
jgi:hypothetical protein